MYRFEAEKYVEDNRELLSGMLTDVTEDFGMEVEWSEVENDLVNYFESANWQEEVSPTYEEIDELLNIFIKRCEEKLFFSLLAKDKISIVAVNPKGELLYVLHDE